MSKYKNIYIEEHRFEHLLASCIPYDGFIIGIGYTSSRERTMHVSELEGYIPEEEYGTEADSHLLIVNEQVMDFSPEAVVRSLNLTPNDILGILVKTNNEYNEITLKNGKTYQFQEEKEIQVIIEEKSDELVLTVRGINGTTGKNIHARCLLRDMHETFEFNIFSTPKKGKGVGQPGFWESLIPLWGPGREAIDDFQNNKYLKSTWHGVVAASDIFLLRSIIKGCIKGAWKTGSHTWGATRKWALKRGYVNPYEPLHHWALTREFSKKHGYEWLANQPWNLKNMRNQTRHMILAHKKDYGIPFLPKSYRVWYSTPQWTKSTAISTTGRITIISMNNE